MGAAVWDVGVTTLLHHCRRRSHGGRGDVADAAEVHRRHRALAVLQAVDRHLGDAVVVHEGAGHHEAVEYLMTVELQHAADIEGGLYCTPYCHIRCVPQPRDAPGDPQSN